ncbi:MAG TPA: MoaD family protein [Candidatus Lokiarchaeia archaeon]|nr:MoaD family protein [Candidatus Lokiarchaeia archaeon]
MPSVKITFLSFIARIVGEKSANVDMEFGTTIEQLLEMLVSRYGQDFEERVYNTTDGLNRFVIILVNGIDMRSLNGLGTVLEPDADIQLLPAIAGG